MEEWRIELPIELRHGAKDKRITPIFKASAPTQTGSTPALTEKHKPKEAKSDTAVKRAGRVSRKSEMKNEGKINAKSKRVYPNGDMNRGDDSAGSLGPAQPGNKRAGQNAATGQAASIL